MGLRRVREVIDLTDKESEALMRLASQQGMSANNVMRAALRHYQMVTERARRGESIVWRDASGAPVIEEVGGCMGDDDIPSGGPRP